MIAKEFNKAQCISNIRVLAKDKGIKLGQLETEAGVSPGYLSRMDKEDNTSSPSIEMLYSVSQQLDVSLDLIVSGKYDALTDNEVYMCNFLERVSLDTIHDKLDWKRETPLDISKVYCTGGGETEHPLYRSENFTPIYDSHFFKENDVAVTGDILSTNLEGNAYMYIVPVDKDTLIPVGEDEFETLRESCYEVYLVERNYEGYEINPLCATSDISEEITGAVKKLYDTVLEVKANLGLDRHVRGIISRYMDSRRTPEVQAEIPSGFVSLPDDDILF